MSSSGKKARIADIPTETFNQILFARLDQGWRKVSEYQGFDAWIDYGSVTLRKDDLELYFEWDNWFEGIIEGPQTLISEIENHYGPQLRKNAADTASNNDNP